jgi:hypothetical protein
MTPRGIESVDDLNAKYVLFDYAVAHIFRITVEVPGISGIIKRQCLEDIREIEIQDPECRLVNLTKY